jgi:hypothetical protein
MNVFDLVIYAIAALAVILLFFQLLNVFFPQTTEISKIKSALNTAILESFNGQSVSAGIIQYQGGTTIDVAQFDTKDKLVAFECNNSGVCCIKASDAPKQECKKEFSWEAAYLKVTQTKQALTTVRCTRINNYPACKIFVGSLPAQAKIQRIEVLEQNKAIGEIKITAQNSGATTIEPGKLTLKLYKKVGAEWMLSDYISDPKDVPAIVTGENYPVLWSINPKTSGEYKAEFTYDALNGGLDKNSTTLIIDAASNCVIDNSTPSETTYYPDTGNFREVHSCTGCNYAYECAAAWSTQTGKQFIGVGQNQAYCVKTSENGNC